MKNKINQLKNCIKNQMQQFGLISPEWLPKFVRVSIASTKQRLVISIIAYPPYCTKQDIEKELKTNTNLMWLKPTIKEDASTIEIDYTEIQGILKELDSAIESAKKTATNRQATADAEGTIIAKQFESSQGIFRANNWDDII